MFLPFELFVLKPCMHFYSPPCVPHDLHITLALILWSQQYVVWTANHEDYDYAILSSRVLPCPSYTQRSSSAPHPRTLSPYWYILSLTLEIKFRTHTKRRKLQLCTRSCCYIGQEKTKILHRKVQGILVNRFALYSFTQAILIY
jgi:hypothetical protein